MAGGKGTSCSRTSRTVASSSQNAASAPAMTGRALSRIASMSNDHAAPRVTTCPVTSAWDAPPATHKALSKSRSEEHTSELQSLMRISYAAFCLQKKIEQQLQTKPHLSNKLYQ